METVYGTTAARAIVVALEWELQQRLLLYRPSESRRLGNPDFFTIKKQFTSSNLNHVLGYILTQHVAVYVLLTMS